MEYRTIIGIRLIVYMVCAFILLTTLPAKKEPPKFNAIEYIRLGGDSVDVAKIEASSYDYYLFVDKSGKPKIIKKWFWQKWDAREVQFSIGMFFIVLLVVTALSMILIAGFAVILVLFDGDNSDNTRKRPIDRLYSNLFLFELALLYVMPLFWLLSVLERCFKAFVSGIWRYADFKGRATRSEFWWLVLSVILTDAIVFCTSVPIAVWLKPDFELSEPLYIVVLAVIVLLLFVPVCSCAVRRCNDVKKSGVSEVSTDGRRVIVATRASVLGDKNDEYHQHGPSCSVKTQQIILNEFGVPVGEKQCCDYAASRGWYYSKTNKNACPSWNVIGNLLEHYGVPIRRYEHATINDLMRELTQGHMIIVSVDSSELYMNKWFRRLGEKIRPDHALIVNGIDVSDSNRKVAYITDTAVGIHNYDCPLDCFMDAWQDSKGLMLATQKPIPGWKFGQDIKPYEFNLDKYPYCLVRQKD